MTKRSNQMIRRFILILVLTLFAASAQAQNVLILKSQDLDSYNEAISGVIDGLSAAGANIEQTDISAQQGTFKNLWQSQPDLVISIGTKATKVAKERITNVPMVFAMVFEPHKNGITDQPGQPTQNITGVAADIPVDVHLSYIERIMPNVKQVGLLYSTFSQTFISELMTEVESRPLSVTSIEVNSSKDVPSALQKLDGNIDAFWIIPDPTVVEKNSRQQIMLHLLRNNVPIIGIAPNFVKAGAVYCLSIDSYQVGKQAADISNQILGGTSPAEIPIQNPQNLKVTYNASKLNELGLSLPPDIASSATPVSN